MLCQKIFYLFNVRSFYLKLYFYKIFFYTSRHFYFYIKTREKHIAVELNIGISQYRKIAQIVGNSGSSLCQFLFFTNNQLVPCAKILFCYMVYENSKWGRVFVKFIQISIILLGNQYIFPLELACHYFYLCKYILFALFSSTIQQ